MIDLKSLKRAAKGRLVYVGARITDDDKKALDAICKREGVSASSLIAELIRTFLADRKQKEKEEICKLLLNPGKDEE